MTFSMKEKSQHLQQLPQVNELLMALEGKSDDAALLKEAVRDALDAARKGILAAEDEERCRALADRVAIEASILSALAAKGRPALMPVVNATGVILHTNLGRSLLSEDAIANISALTGRYANLEYDVDAGRRGSRHDILSGLLREITGAEDAMVVNNNASAVLLAISALTAPEGEVIVSRGELVEIGGSFRIPEIIELSGATLREIGTTNKVHPADYERAAESEAAEVLLKVHTSNFKIMGFTEEVELPALREIADRHDLPLIYDLGSGLMHPLSDVGIREPDVLSSLAAGADLVLFSGDKLLGGPQAGIAIGKREYISRMKRHPLARVVRMDKMSFAALEATLKSYRNPEKARKDIPVLSMIAKRPENIQKEAEAMAEALKEFGYFAEVARDQSEIGGGSCPGEYLDTYVVSVEDPKASAASLEEDLRKNDPPIVARIRRDRLLIDARTLRPGDTDTILRAMKLRKTSR